MNVGANVDTASGVISPHYNVMLPSKSFTGNVTANGLSLQNFISTTLSNNTYSAANVISSKQYAIDNGFVSGYAELTSSSFDTAGITTDLQEVAEQRLAVIKTEFANGRFID
jgi:hypothetical protein